MGRDRTSTVGVIGIPNREQLFKNADIWIEEKQAIDGAEGLWRIHDDLYDVTDFVDKHPGGKFWLEVSKGLDITEAFEAHHISTYPETVLKKYFVRKAKAPRSSPFTFEENGFYRTLKRNVREELKTIPKSDTITSAVIMDALLATTFVLSVCACKYWSYPIGIVAGLFMSFSVIGSHNYFHQKDNFRMYYSYFGMMSAREWRIIHIMSHHLFTNTVADMQAYITEPFINVYPESKPIWYKYASWIYAPLIFWPISILFVFFVKMYYWLFKGYTKSVCKAELLQAVLPLTMYALGGQSLLASVGMWVFIVLIHGFWFNLIANATTHYHPDLFVDGDTQRPEKDWGIHQLDTVFDKNEVTGNHFLVMITFGDHALHHLFPTMDHGILHHLYPVVLRTMKDFNLDMRFTSFPDLIGGFFRQMAKDVPNPSPPNLLDAKYTRHW